MFNKIVFIVILGLILSCSKDDESLILEGIDEEFIGEIDLIKTIGGSQQDDFLSVVATTDGGYIQTGHSESDDFDISDPEGSYDIWVVKTSGDGDLVWQKNLEEAVLKLLLIL